MTAEIFERGYPLREQSVSVPILRPVFDSDRLRRWLLPRLSGTTQAEKAAHLGVAQSTMNRIVNQDSYDFPLNTVVQIAKLFGHRSLSDFFLHLENSDPSDLTSHSIGVKSASPGTLRRQEKPSAKGDADGGAHVELSADLVQSVTRAVYQQLGQFFLTQAGPTGTRVESAPTVHHARHRQSKPRR